MNESPLQPHRGTLKTWKADRGFGFITPDAGGRDVFVHIRDFGAIARAPRVGDAVRYQAMRDGTGRLRAGDVFIDGVPRHTGAPARGQRAGATAGRRQRHVPRHGNPTSRRGGSAPGLRRLMLSVLVLAALSIGHWWPAISARFDARPAPVPVTGAMPVMPSFACDGRQHCSQMTSCDEARYFLRNCPDTRMDGDHDGIPCESQWCQ